jgi:Co/Zn/Cd efflux system component
MRARALLLSIALFRTFLPGQHVFADTMRSSAVLIVAAVATAIPSIRPEQADAVAAVAVSLIILVSLVPLLRGLWTTAAQIVHLHRHPCCTTVCSD